MNGEHTPRPVTAVIKGSGFNSVGGGFTRIHINGKTYHPNDVALAVECHGDMLAVLKRIETVMDFDASDHPMFDGLQAQMNAAIARATGATS